MVTLFLWAHLGSNQGPPVLPIAIGTNRQSQVLINIFV